MTLLLLQSGPGRSGGVATTAPANTVLPVISGATIVGSVLTTTNGTWTGTPTITYAYQWKRGGTNVGTNATTYTSVVGDVGATITVTVTATNAGGSASATSSGVGPIVSSSVTWDAATVTAVTLSGGNLVATNTGTTSADQGARVATASGKTSGKYYFEFAFTNLIGGVANGANFGIGIGTTSSTYTSMGNGGGVTGIEYYKGQSVWANGTNVIASSTQVASGQNMGVAVDLDNRRVWFKKLPSGNWNENASFNPATNTGGYTIVAGTMVPFVTYGGSTGSAGLVSTANFGASSFTGAVPSGFTSGWPV